MEVKQILDICLNVLKDFRVIITVVAMLFIVKFARYITNYTKKAPKPKKAKAVKQPKTEEKKEAAEYSGEEESAAE